MTDEILSSTIVHDGRPVSFVLARLTTGEQRWVACILNDDAAAAKLEAELLAHERVREFRIIRTAAHVRGKKGFASDLKAFDEWARSLTPPETTQDKE